MSSSQENIEFHWADYVVFAASLALSLGIGFFFAFKDRKKADTTEYLLGGNGLNPIAVGMSIAASLMNAVFLIGKLHDCIILQNALKFASMQ